MENDVMRGMSGKKRQWIIRWLDILTTVQGPTI